MSDNYSLKEIIEQRCDSIEKYLEEIKSEVKKTNDRVTTLEKNNTDVPKKVSTLWDWRHIVVGGGIVIIGSLSYLIPMSIKFVKTVNELQYVVTGFQNDWEDIKEDVANQVVLQLEAKYDLEIQ